MGKRDSVLSGKVFPKTMFEEYAALGWHLLPMAKKSKKISDVVGKGWQKKSSRDIDQIEEWFSSCRHNVALHLGPISGVVDIESDTEAGNDLLEKLFGATGTPCWSSPRGTHYLFLWDKDLSEFPKTRYEVDGIEFRIGGVNLDGDPMGCVSKIPPSEDREWIISPADSIIQPLPRKAVEMIASAAVPMIREKMPEEFVPLPDPPEVIEKRCMAWVDTVEGAIAYKKGHNATFRVACKLINDFRAPFDIALKCMLHWNDRCEPPWEEKELARKLEEAKKHAQKTPGCAYDVADVDMEEFIKPRRIFRKKDIGDFPQECLRPPGLIGEIVDYNNTTARCPQPELALAGALALMSALTGRKIESNDRCRTNLYVIGIADSTEGKNYSLSVNHMILEAAEIEKSRLIGAGSMVSAPGIVSFLALTPSCLFQCDEIGAVLKASTSDRALPHNKNISVTMTDLYTASSRTWTSAAYADLRKTRTIEHPHLCLYGQSTPAVLWDSLSEESASEGLLGRLTVIKGRTNVKSIKGARPKVPVPDSIVDQVRWWMDGELNHNMSDIAPSPIFVIPEPDAQARYDEYAEQVEEKAFTESRRNKSLWRRGIEKTLKYALLFAASRNSFKTDFTINFNDMDLAIKMSNFLTRSMVHDSRMIASNEWQKNVNEIVRILEDNDGIISMGDLTKKCRKIRPRERNDIIKELEIQGVIEMRIVNTSKKKGRPPVMIELIEEYE